MNDSQIEIQALREEIRKRDAKIQELEKQTKLAAKDIHDLVNEIKRMRALYGLPMVLDVGEDVASGMINPMPVSIGYALDPVDPTAPKFASHSAHEERTDWLSRELTKRFPEEKPVSLQQGWRPSDEQIQTKKGGVNGKDL